MYRWQMILAAFVISVGAIFSVAVTRATKSSADEVRDAPKSPSRLVLARVEGVKVGDPQRFGSLTMFPIVGANSGKLDYLTLDEAMSRGVVKVREKGEGEVNTIVIKNVSGDRVFIMDGEEVVGSKQNRIINSSVMIAPKQVAQVPVSCVEQGRWAMVSDEFKSGGTQLFARARQSNTVAVTTNLAAAPAAGQRSDQSMIWDKVAEKRSALRMGSASGPMHEAYETRGKDIDDYVKHFEVVTDQVGAVFAINGEIVGADIFDQSGTLKRLFPKLVKSYALDAIEADANPVDKKSMGKLDRDAAQQFLKRVLASGVKLRDYDSPGEGRDVRITSSRITGAGLVVNGTAVHVSLFASQDDDPVPVKSGPISPASQRRQGMGNR